MTEEEVAVKMELYDRLCEEGASHAHLCGFEGGKCLRGDPNCCVVQPGSARANCDQLDPGKGCRVNTVMCKIWYCAFIKELHPELKPLIERWNEEAKGLPGILFFQDRGDYESSLKGEQHGHPASMG